MTKRLNASSRIQRYTPTTATAMMTTTVAERSWRWPGHSTFFSSATHSRTKCPKPRRSRFEPVCAFASPVGLTRRLPVAGALADPRAGCGRGRVALLAPGTAGLPCHLLGTLRSAGLAVSCMTTAPAAVLRELDAVGRVPLRFHGLVVAPLAVGAGKRDRNSNSGFRHRLLFRSDRVAVAAGGLEPPTRGL